MIVVALKLCQRSTARYVQAGQFIIIAFQLCHIALNDDGLAFEFVVLVTVPTHLPKLLSSLDGDATIGLDGQSDWLSDRSGGGHGDDAFGEEGGGDEERAEEDEEPDT